MMKAWISLNMTPFVGPRAAAKLLQRFGSAENVFHATGSELESIRLRAEAIETAPPEPPRKPVLEVCEAQHRPAKRERVRRREPKLAGQLVINFEIDAEGNVVDTRQGMQDGQLEDEGVVTCVSDVVKKIKFAKSAAGKSTRGYPRFEWTAR